MASVDYGTIPQNEPGVQTSTCNFKVYRRRWYCLFVFAMMAFTQTLMWNTWGPIAASAKCAFFWTNTEISLLVAWGPVLYMLTVFPSVWLADAKGKSYASTP